MPVNLLALINTVIVWKIAQQGPEQLSAGWAHYFIRSIKHFQRMLKCVDKQYENLSKKSYLYNLLIINGITIIDFVYTMLLEK